MTEIIAANDIGTTQVKSICIYKTRPNSSHKEEFLAVLGETKDLLTPDPGLMKIETDDGEWFVGDSAEEYSKNLTWGRGDGWALSPHYKALHLYSIARHVGNSTREVNAFLMSGLPRADYNRRGEVEQSLLGRHTIRTPGRDRMLTINIVNVYFAIQGWSAIMAEGFTKGQMVAWLGLGGRNKTYATINRNGKIVPDQTDSNEGGLLDAIDELEDVVGKEFGIELSKQGWIQALQDKFIQLGDGKLDISDYANQILDSYVSATFSLIREVWNERRDMPFISDFRIGGGGALEIGENISQQFQKARVVNNPRWTEAEGLMTLGIARYL